MIDELDKNSIMMFHEIFQSYSYLRKTLRVDLKLSAKDGLKSLAILEKAGYILSCEDGKDHLLIKPRGWQYYDEFMTKMSLWFTEKYKRKKEGVL